METRLNYAAVGLFVIVFIALWIAFSIWLLFGNPNVSYDRYHVYMSESVSGLVEDAGVTYLGVPVGKVEEIGLRPGHPSQVRLVLSIRRETPVKTDTKATLRAQGVTGLYWVELQGGSAEAPLLRKQAGDEVPVIESVPSMFARLEYAATGMLEDVRGVLDRLKELLSEDNVDSLKSTLDNVEQLSASIAENRPRIDGAIEDASRSMADLRQLTGRLAERADLVERTITDFSTVAGRAVEASEGLPAVMEDVHAMSGELREASRKLNRLVSGGSAGVEQFSATTVTDINQLIYEMRTTLDSLQRIGRQLERRPNSLLFGEPRREPGPGEERQ